MRRYSEEAREAAVAIIMQARRLVGRKYKLAIWNAWGNGNYESEGLGSIAGQLQGVRNNFGPTWLANLRLPPQ